MTAINQRTIKIAFYVFYLVINNVQNYLHIATITLIPSRKRFPSKIFYFLKRLSSYHLKVHNETIQFPMIVYNHI
jgi:hypothetical protein